MSDSIKITLTRAQADFLKYMVEETNSQDALEKFAKILAEERVETDRLVIFLDKLMDKWNKKGGESGG